MDAVSWIFGVSRANINRQTVIKRCLYNSLLHVMEGEVPNQDDVCREYGVSSQPPGGEEKLGVAFKTLGLSPINGLRYKPENGTCGWYIWCGEELSQEQDFFEPLHVRHIHEYFPEVAKYLALPPGYRFLVAGDYSDVWYDPEIDHM